MDHVVVGPSGDTPNWYNGFNGANGGKGHTCEEYVSKGMVCQWSGGSLAKNGHWGRSSTILNSNCVACGKGKAIAVTYRVGSRSLNDIISKDHLAVDPLGDTPNWYNGYIGANGGKGYTCADYVSKGWCKVGIAGFPIRLFLGALFKYPERNCVACGKKASNAGISARMQLTL